MVKRFIAYTKRRFINLIKSQRKSKCFSLIDPKNKLNAHCALIKPQICSITHFDGSFNFIWKDL